MGESSIYLNYLEINVSVLVHVECTENVIAEFHCVPGWEKHLVHVDKLSGCKPAIGAILLQIIQKNKHKILRKQPYLLLVSYQFIHVSLHLSFT